MVQVGVINAENDWVLEELIPGIIVNGTHRQPDWLLSHHYNTHFTEYGWTNLGDALAYARWYTDRVTQPAFNPLRRLRNRTTGQIVMLNLRLP